MHRDDTSGRLARRQESTDDSRLGMDNDAVMRKQVRFFFLVFTASGFAGLIYESIWTHYLKLFLGHAAYAQALVLAVFMGGMAVGSLLCSKYSERLGNLLIGYAIIEVIIGICAVLFHPLYTRFIKTAFTSFIPALSSPMAVAAFKWSTATVLILPQSILLGMTFPLMTAGLIRRFPHAPGSIVAMLYFTNSIGAAVGVLAAGFLFIGWSGLPGTLVIAGIINFLVAAAVWIEDRRAHPLQRERLVPPGVAAPAAEAPHRTVYALFLAIALLTGLSSFIYEIGWIRMLSLVLGSSTHAFELMLSAFISGIAFGGLWIKRRIDSIDDPRRFLALVQVAMGLLALATLPVYGGTFNAMSWLMGNLPITETGYVLFNIASHGIAMVIMLPAAFCAGMTLPLITTALLRSGTGERSIGAVYGFNTIGSILGVITAIHLAMPLLGLKGMIMLGAGIDIALGLGIAWWVVPSRSLRAVYSTVGILALVVTAFWVTLDPNKMASGVYRGGALWNAGGQQTVFHRDGKTATVSITQESNIMSIRTNGKIDAGIQIDGRGHSQDEETMVLAGALGIMLHPEASKAAIIGWGSGLTTHTLLTDPRIKSVDTIEIEPEMIRAATFFGPRVRLAYDDPRSHRHIEDAKSYFSFHNKKYDIIISEPSNPWVSGVASLFTQEFYARIRDYLNENGILIQWMQLYDIDLPLVASIMNALAPYFSDYVVYAASAVDMLIVACPEGTIRKPDSSFLSVDGLAAEMRRIGVNGISDIDIRFIGNKRMLAPVFAGFSSVSNSDYEPIVDLYAVRSRFLHVNAFDQLIGARLQRLPIIPMLGGQPAGLDSRNVTFAPFPKSQLIYRADAIYQYFMQGQWRWVHDRPLSDELIRSTVHAKQVLIQECSKSAATHEWWRTMLHAVAYIIPSLSQQQSSSLVQVLLSPTCSKHYTEHQRNFLHLLDAVGKRDAALMARYSTSLLQQAGDPMMQADLLEYLLLAGMLGNISAGNTAEAALLWDRYARLLPAASRSSLPARYLVAQLSQ
jgi:predicted membrane-bound spermidine synthase